MSECAIGISVFCLELESTWDAEMEWTLPCELHHIEPGVIFNLTHRDGPRFDNAVDRFPAPPFNRLFHRDHAVTPPTFMSERAAPSPQNAAVHADDYTIAMSVNNGDDNRNGVDAKVYVNPKQHARIVRRRAIRTQLRNKLIRENKMQTLYKIGDGRKMIKFKSRHAQAKRRPRGPGGQFLSKDTPSPQSK